MIARLLLIFVFLLTACSSNKTRNSQKRKSVTSFYQSSGFEKYILGQLPQWSNYSMYGKCLRGSQVRYLNYSQLTRGLNFTYEQSMQAQMLFNESYKKILREKELEGLSPKQEDKLFQSVLDKVSGGIKSFRQPKFKRIHFIWVDYALRSKKAARNLGTLLKSLEMDKGFPVFISTCLAKSELETWLNQNNWDDRRMEILSSESFAPYKEQGKTLSYQQIHLSKLFGQNYELHFYSPLERIPRIFKGIYTPHKF